MSTEAADLAATSTSCSGTSRMPVASLIVSVVPAAAASATNGSWVCQYSCGRSPPPGQGDWRLVGMWVCSGNQSDSKPRSSASLASSPGWIA